TRCLSDWSSDVCSSDLPKAARLHDRSRVRGADDGFRLLHAAYEKGPVEYDGKQEIRRRPRSDDRDAPPDSLAIERPVRFFRRDQIGRASCRERVEGWGQ